VAVAAMVSWEGNRAERRKDCIRVDKFPVPGREVGDPGLATVVGRCARAKLPLRACRRRPTGVLWIPPPDASRRRLHERRYDGGETCLGLKLGSSSSDIFD
jgi:hypothetical protein